MIFATACSTLQTANTPALSPNTPQVETTLAQPSTPDARPLTEVDLTIHGVRSGMPEAKVIALLGKPRRTEKGEFDHCADYYHRYMIYDGLTIDLLGDKHQPYSVTSMDLTSSKWDIAPGIHIGDPISKVRETYGEPVSEDGESLGYVTKGNEGWVIFSFENGKLIKAEMTETLC